MTGALIREAAAPSRPAGSLCRSPFGEKKSSIHSSSRVSPFNPKNSSSPAPPAQSWPCSNGESGYAGIDPLIGDDAKAEPLSRPQLLCACRIPLQQKTSQTERNPGRDFYACQKIGTNEKYVCKTWIWVDLVRDYVEQMIKFRTRNSMEKLSALQEELEHKIEALSCREREVVQHGRDLQRESSELKSQIVGLQSTATRFKGIRMLMVLFVATCWFIAPGSLVITMAATTILAMMFLVV